GIDPGGAGEIPHGGAILGRDVAEPEGTGEAAGAVDVLHDDAGLAFDVFRDMPRKEPALDVGWTAGRIVDHDGQSLALVERIGRRRDRGAERDRAYGNQRGIEAPCRHRNLLFLLRALDVVGDERAHQGRRPEYQAHLRADVGPGLVLGRKLYG